MKNAIITAAFSVFAITSQAQTPNDYQANQYGRTGALVQGEALPVVVVSVREVDVDPGRDPARMAAGVAIGGALGAAAGGAADRHSGGYAGSVLGGVLGGALGGSLARPSPARGQEIVFKVEGKEKYLVVVQAGGDRFQPGEKLMAVSVNGSLRLARRSI